MKTSSRWCFSPSPYGRAEGPGPPGESGPGTAAPQAGRAPVGAPAAAPGRARDGAAAPVQAALAWVRSSARLLLAGAGPPGHALQGLTGQARVAGLGGQVVQRENADQSLL